MNNDEKINLITEIHTIFYEQLDSFENIGGLFLAYLYPAIAAGEKCQLWGSSYDDLILLLFLQNNFSPEHKIWDFLECLETESFVVESKYYAKKSINGEFILDTNCYYNVYNKTCYGMEDNIDNWKGELVSDWLVFELEPNALFNNGYVFQVDKPQKVCDDCGENVEKCSCKC